MHGKNQADSEEDLKEEASGVDFQEDQGSSSSPLFSRRFPRFRKNCLGEGASLSRNEDFEQIFLRRRHGRIFGPSGVRFS